VVYPNDYTLADTFTSLVYFMNENTLSRDYYGMRRPVKLLKPTFDLIVCELQKTHIIIMATMKTGTICNIHGSYDYRWVIGTRVDGLVFRTFLSGNCYTLLLTLVQ